MRAWVSSCSSRTLRVSKVRPALVSTSHARKDQEDLLKSPIASVIAMMASSLLR